MAARSVPLPRPRSSDVLTSRFFLVSVALLVLNDWMLKTALGSWVTGKLSDFAGLAAFAILWTALLPRRRDAVFALTAVGFMIWKSPASEGPLVAWNALGVWPLARVVDYTDWIALAALVPAYRATSGYLTERHRPRRGLAPRLGAFAAAGIAIIAFTATSVALPRHQFDDTTTFPIPATRSEVRAGLEALGLDPRSEPFRGRSADTTADRADTLVIYLRQPPERRVAVSFEARQTTATEVALRILGASAPGPEPRLESIRTAFGKQVVEPLREWVAGQRRSKE